MGGNLMKFSSLTEKIEYVRRTRAQNYRASLKLEGIIVGKINKDSLTKEQLIEKYKLLTQ